MGLWAEKFRIHSESKTSGGSLEMVTTKRVRQIDDVIDDDNHIVTVQKSAKLESSTHVVPGQEPNFNSIIGNVVGLNIATDEEAKVMMQYGE